MKVIVCKNYEEMSAQAAARVAALMREKPDCTLGLATGSTPIGTYEQLVEMHRAGELDFSAVTSFNLDEYYPLSPENDQSYRWFMQHHLFDHVNIRPEATHVPNGLAADPAAECRAYDAAIAANGGIDLQILGIGRNGHIGFNEPGAALVTGTHLTELTDNTIEANARFFEKKEDVPTKALTMGIGSIFMARSILLLANGEGKREAIAALLDDTLRTDSPATMLKLHPDVTILCDEAAYPLDR